MCSLGEKGVIYEYKLLNYIFKRVTDNHLYIFSFSVNSCWFHTMIFSNICSGEDIVVGYGAAAQAEKNAANTIYDAKRFIGKRFLKEDLAAEAERYAFQVRLLARISSCLIPCLMLMIHMDISCHV